MERNSSIPVSGKTAAKFKSLTPAVLGMTNSHGAKLSLHMASEDKKQLLSKLEEWRKARREKLAATIMSKMSQAKPMKSPASVIPAKPKPAVLENPTNPNRLTVFERLYSNAKIKPEGSSRPSQIPKTNFKRSDDKKNKPVKALVAVNDGSKKDTSGEKPIIDKAMESPKSLSVESYTDDQIKTNELKTVKSFKSLPPGKPLRRSISMVFRQKRQTDFTVRRSLSAKNIHELKSTTTFQPKEMVKPIKNDTTLKSVSFVTPKQKSLTSSNLRTKLENWLKINGHPLEGYRHLRCFGLNHHEKFLGTPKISHDVLDTSNYETAPNTPAEESDKENITPQTVIQQVHATDVENWLKELHRLIVEVKYPPERCEEWLSAIRKKCTSCTQLPVYWECLAALHESKGDLKSAIEDYERVIIKGGEVDVVGDSLAELFDKMVIEQKKGVNRKLEKGLDPKNIFKSTIIKFALQQKALKNLNLELDPNVRQQLYVATPVRRSTRIQTPYKSTGEVASLQKLSPEILRNITFKPNESLLGD